MGECDVFCNGNANLSDPRRIGEIELIADARRLVTPAGLFRNVVYTIEILSCAAASAPIPRRPSAAGFDNFSLLGIVYGPQKNPGATAEIVGANN